MLSKDVKEFSQALYAEKDLMEYDKIFLKEIHAAFSNKDDSIDLNEGELRFLSTLFRRRWDYIFDSCDYTLKISGPNKHWITLAESLSHATGELLINILMPVVSLTPTSYDPALLKTYASYRNMLDFYFSENGTTLYLVEGLLRRIQPKHKKLFLTYDDVEKKRARCLSLREFSRIRAKEGPFDVSGDYSTFWHYLKEVEISTWHQKMSLLNYFFPPLLALLNEYFFACEKGVQPTLLLNRWWELNLKRAPIEDVNCLYGQVIPVMTRENPTTTKFYYLLEILLDVLELKNDPSIEDKMLGISSWLLRQNPSLLVDSSFPRLFDLYKKHKVGIGFDISALETLVLSLKGQGTALESRLIVSLLDELLVSISASGIITTTMIEKLKTVYAERWQQIKGTNLEYTQKPGRQNQIWIQGAQQLKGAGYIEEDYYVFLMPTLLSSTDPVLLSPLSTYPLSYYILSEEEDRLINVLNCWSHFKRHGTYYNCNVEPPRPLTKVEQVRLHFVNPRFHKQINQALRIPEEEPPVSRRTILAIKHLVDETVFEYGEDENLVKAAIAYADFYQFLDKTLSKEERLLLYAQRIYKREAKTTFAAVIREVRAKEGCIALAGYDFARLVRAYCPSAFFRFQHSSEMDDYFRQSSFAKPLRKRYSDHATLSEEDALKRLRALAISFALYFGNYSFIDSMLKKLHQVSFEGYSCNMSEWAGSIFSVLQTYIDPSFLIAPSGGKELLNAYWGIIDKVEEHQQHSDAKRDRAYSKWLESIVDGTIFKTACWVETSQLFSCFTSMIYNDEEVLFQSSYKEKIDDFLDNISYSLRDKPCHVFVMNVHLWLILKEDEQLHRHCFNRFQGPNAPSELLELQKKFLIHRLATIGAKDKRFGFFSAKTMNEKIYKELRIKFLSDKDKEPEELLNSVCTGITTVRYNLEGMKKYQKKYWDANASLTIGSSKSSSRSSLSRSSFTSSLSSGT